MSIEVWLLYVGTVLIFMSTPGPSHLLMLSNSLVNGFNKSTATAAGDLSANFLQMIAASLGLATLLSSSENVFSAIKWAGVFYLAYLGVRMILSKRMKIGTGKQSSRALLYWQGFITSAANPKAVIFFAALFPQFLSLEQALFPQFLVLSITYLIVDGAFLCFYGKFAEVFRERVLMSHGHLLTKISGGLFLAAAVVLGVKDLDLVAATASL
jgi:threonine/homoserine/homoserine lactone efflux protein